MKKKILIGLTGPIAAGKNCAAHIFGRHGAYVIDADVVGHQVLEPQSKVWHMIVRTFGSKVLSRGGRVNRKKLGRMVFADPKALKKLNSITHPAIKKRIVELINSSKKKVVVVNAAILFEMKVAGMMDKVIAVIAKRSIRLKRLMKKGKRKEEAIARIRSQKSDACYRAIADIVITNNSTKDSFAKKIKTVLRDIWANLN